MYDLGKCAVRKVWTEGDFLMVAFDSLIKHINHIYIYLIYFIGK